MIDKITGFASKALTLSWMTGPIFDKELRVSSRRRRNYVLRFIYPVLLTIFMVLLWVSLVDAPWMRHYYGARRVSHMAEAGKYIIVSIVWFQFCAAQLLAMIMLSNAISDEIYHRTLGTLMSTPINGFQIVMGKLCSKLLQIILMTMISLPLLAIVRVFGGVPWDYVVSSLCITISCVVFVGSLTLFYSILSRRAYVVIILTVLTLGFLFVLIPIITIMIIAYSGFGSVSEMQFFSVMSYLNPGMNMMANTIPIIEPRGSISFYWPVHCLIMLLAAGVLLLVSVAMVRKVALLQAVGQLGNSSRSSSRKKNIPVSVAMEQDRYELRRVKGPPVLWKELRAPLFGRRKVLTFLIVSVCLVLLILTYALLESSNNLSDEGVHVMYFIIFMSIGLLFTIVLPSTCITSEKEARSWPILMATPLSDSQIAWSKFIASVRRCLPIWILMFGHIILFYFVGYIHPWAIVQMGVLVAGLIVFLCGSGLLFSTLFKRTTTAVVMNFVLVAMIWGIIPLVMGVMTLIVQGNGDFVEHYCNLIPFVQAAAIADSTVTSSGYPDSAYWASGRMDAVETTALIFAFSIGYMLAGLSFVAIARQRFRRKML